MNALEEALVSALDVLEAGKVHYAISGSLAAAHHGHVRATGAIDIQVGIKRPAGAEELAEALEPEVRRVDAWTWRFLGDVDVELYPVTDALDVDELERLLALDPAWAPAWDELVETAP